MVVSKLEEKFDELCDEWKIPRGVKEFMFAKSLGRRWRFDRAYPQVKVAVELEGGIWMGKQGRHTNPKGFESDAEKYNAAALMGWKVFRLTANMMKVPQNMWIIKTALKGLEE